MGDGLSAVASKDFGKVIFKKGNHDIRRKYIQRISTICRK